MTENEFTEQMKELINRTDILQFDNHKNFHDEFSAGNTVYLASIYIKRYREKPEHLTFCVDEDQVDELKKIANDINKELTEMTKQVESDRFNPHFSHFVRSYWNIGFEVNISERNKEKEIRREEDWDEYEEDRFYSPSNPWDAPGMKVSDFI